MIEVTEVALQKLIVFWEEEGGRLPVRIALMSGAVGSANLGVITDDITEKDESYDFDGFKIIVDKSLITYCQNIVIDWVPTDLKTCAVEGGFKISAKNHI